ncbi:transmembrane protease serine 9-like [Galleria mellonella]|uniref:Transmembrane protease serine 9-like n=1 Tax=Galleria mellonella TaxID=7137 RepID=A0ABM3MEJ9_GALME|nr:transmembrane protease serine 9-like [Galleria mellonella]
MFNMLRTIVFVLLPHVLCATRTCNGDSCTRIIGGEISEQNSRPFQVALYSRVGTTGELGFCGGSLIHQEWIITAAHCCFHNEVLVDHVQAILGAHSLYDRYENGRRIVNVVDIVVHPDWDADTFTNDVALLKLANVIQLTDTIGIVRLPYLSTASHNFAGSGATVSGWGIVAEGVTFVSPTLREKLMTVITDTLCNSSYSNLLPATTVCGITSDSGTCKGDNGGPMTIPYSMHQDEEPETILIGVASFVSNTGCNTYQPSVFTRVQYYLHWISNVTGIHMRILVLLGVVAVVTSNPLIGVRSPLSYHEEIGFPLAKRIKEAEDRIFAGRDYDAVEEQDARIVGGVVAPSNAHPYLAGLIINFVGISGQSACGSSLISATRLVTAAHCWSYAHLQGQQLTVVLGSHYLFYGGTRLLTSTVVVHPQWNQNNLHNDVAVIYLQQSVAFSASIQPIALPANHLNDQFIGEWSTAAGYGFTSDQQTGINFETVVSQVNLQVISVAQCQAIFGGYVIHSTICTSGTGGVGICSGDSGGPLVINKNGQNILVGISSFVAGNGCELGFPSAFARVTSFYSFILNNM